MKRDVLSPLSRPLSILACGILASCATPIESSRTEVSSSIGSSQPLPAIIVQDVNQTREQLGVPALKRHAGLDRLAQKHSEFLRQNRGSFSLHGKNVSHHGSESRALVAINRLEMINYGENVAWTVRQPNPAAASQALIALWKKSPDHREAMLDDHWSHTGVGVVVDSDGSVFATQIFGTKTMSQMTMRDRLNQF